MKKSPRREFMKGSLTLSALGLAATGCVRAGRKTSSSNQCVNVVTGKGLSATRCKEELVEYMRGLEIIDAHEHLLPEKERTDKPADVFTLLATYVKNDFKSAGLPSDVDYNNMDIPLEKRWKLAQPYLEKVQFLSHYRATAITLRDIYGFNEINDRNYREISRAILNNNTPGLYHRVLRQRCNIRTCLVQPIVSRGYVDSLEPRDLLTPVFSGYAAWRPHVPPFMKELETSCNMKIATLDQYLEAVTAFLEDFKKAGAVGVKTYACHWTRTKPDMAQARKDFKEVLNGKPSTKLLEETIRDRVYRFAAETDWPVPVHGGGAYFDFRQFEPRTVIDVIVRYPETRFDLFHLGFPYHHEFICIAKQYPNVTLNLCWCYILSEEITRKAINEILDAVPVNKVVAFGGDYWNDVENVYGHLEVAREVIAEAFSERIALGRMNLEEAKHIAKLWFYDNPRIIYRLT